MLRTPLKKLEARKNLSKETGKKIDQEGYGTNLWKQLERVIQETYKELKYETRIAIGRFKVSSEYMKSGHCVKSSDIILKNLGPSINQEEETNNEPGTCENLLSIFCLRIISQALNVVSTVQVLIRHFELRDLNWNILGNEKKMGRNLEAEILGAWEGGEGMMIRQVAGIKLVNGNGYL